MIDVIVSLVAVVLVVQYARSRQRNAVLFGALTFIGWFLGEYLAAALVSTNSILSVPSIYLGGLLGTIVVAAVLLGLPQATGRK